MLQPARGADRSPQPELVENLTDGPGVSHIDPADPAAPNYTLISRLRSPLTLRDYMIRGLREGYIGQDQDVDPALLPPAPATLFPDVTALEVLVPSPDGAIRCQVHRPRAGAADEAVVLYFHGGGFMVGRSEDTEFLTRKICTRSDVTVVSVNYRLAPEWPFPTGLDDCLTVYRWLLEDPVGLGSGPLPAAAVAFCGDSSGANFAAVAPLRARATGLPAPGATVLLAPLVDMELERYASFTEQAPLGIVYDAAFAGFLRGAYVRYEQWRHPHVSPVHADPADLADYPPAAIFVGTHDPIVDSVRAFAERLEAHSAQPVQLVVEEGMPHGYYFFPGLFAQEEAAYESMHAFLEAHLSRVRGG